MKRRDDVWAAGMSALRAYVAARPGRRLSRSARAGGIDVGRWMDQQRKAYWNGTLTDAEVQDLESVQGWDWDGPARRRWELHLAALRTYAAVHDVGEMPTNVWVGKVRLGEWAQGMQAAHRSGTLPEPLVRSLEDIAGWIWKPEDGRWRAGLAALQHYIEQHGSADPPYDAHVDGVAVGAWVRRMRDDQRAGALGVDRATVLAALPGWRWATTADDRWERAMGAMREYAEQFGHSNPPQSAVHEGFAIGSWVHNRRKEYRSGRLAAERVGELEGLPGWSWGRTTVRPE